MTSVYPYLVSHSATSSKSLGAHLCQPEMIESFGVSEQNVGKYAGMVFAVFALAQASTGLLCGTLSDKYGRKAVILTCLALCVLWNFVWSFSSSVTMAVITRALVGTANGDGNGATPCHSSLTGTVGVIRTVVAEMVPQKHLQPVAFSVMPLVWNTGTIFGPAIGGFLAKPAETMPNLFGKNKLSLKYPFLLPNLFSCALYILGFITALLFIEASFVPNILGIHNNYCHRKRTKTSDIAETVGLIPARSSLPWPSLRSSNRRRFTNITQSAL